MKTKIKRQPYLHESGEYWCIPLTQGYIAKVSKGKSFEKVKNYNWCAHKALTTVYAVAWINGKNTFLHRFLCNSKKYIDHINHDGLDNRDENLRPATPLESVRNRRLQKNSSTGYKGVSIQHPYRACIKVNGKSKNLGMYATIEEAARAYDMASIKYYGEFASLNFPRSDYA